MAMCSETTTWHALRASRMHGETGRRVTETVHLLKIEVSKLTDTEAELYRQVQLIKQLRRDPFVLHEIEKERNRERMRKVRALHRPEAPTTKAKRLARQARYRAKVRARKHALRSQVAETHN